MFIHTISYYSLRLRQPHEEPLAWQNPDLGKFRNLEIWESGDLGIWDLGGSLDVSVPERGA